MKRERKPIFVERRPNNQEFNIRFALVSSKPLLPAENRRMRELASLDIPQLSLPTSLTTQVQ
jgi:hypothetical protein